MSTWILADTHLDSTGTKPMSIFGPVWNKHQEVLRANWCQSIAAEDNVIIAGDISWAMHASEAAADLRYLDELPGQRKILLKGNHDFWWSTRAKIEKVFAENNFTTLELMQNEALIIRDREDPDKDFILVGTRGWKLPSDQDTNAQDKKVFARELQRFNLSIQNIQVIKKKYNETRELPVLAVFHYPPLNKYGDDSEMTELIEKQGIKTVYYGHVHKQYGQDNLLCFEGEKNGVSYHNIALDFINMHPQKIS